MSFHHLPLPYHWELDAETPTDEVCQSVRAVITEHPNWIDMPSRVKAHLRHARDLDVSFGQVAGALVAIRDNQ